MKSQMGKHVARLSALALAAALLSAPGTSRAQKAEAPKLSEIIHLAELSTDNRNPSIVCSKDGQSAFAAWDGIVNGNRRILLREKVGERWLNPVIVDTNPAGNNESPTLGLDDAGNLSVVWVGTVKGRRAPIYARRISRWPNLWHQQAVPFPKDATVSGNCEVASVSLDANGLPWIVWQYGFGSVSSIACSHLQNSGEFSSQELTPGATTHNLDPKIFFRPQPTVYWYVAQSDQFYLVGSQRNPGTGEWQVSSPENLENLPADNLPELFLTQIGRLAAIWYDQAQDEGARADHVYLGVQDPETKGRGEVIDREVGSDYHSVAGSVSGARFVTSWVSESYVEGSQVYLGVGATPLSINPFRVSTEDGVFNGNPQVASGGNSVLVAWEEELPNGASEIALRSLTLK